MFLLSFCISLIVAIIILMGFELAHRRGLGWENLPEHINSPEEWNGKDDDKHWYTKWKKLVKALFAYHWKEWHWFGRIRKNPITLLAFFGEGESRWENDILAIRSVNKPIFFYNPGKTGFYLSRVQYWTKWHLQLQWPLFICCSWKVNKTLTIGGYLGFKRDTDAYWAPSLWVGKGYK